MNKKEIEIASNSKMLISYSDDEVLVFHSLVKKTLTSYLVQNNLSEFYEIVHHPKDSVGTIPDFVITDKLSGKWVFVIEVKRTPNSVKSIRSWNQSRSYVTNNRSSRWASGRNPYFLVTNLELTYLLCDRENTSTPFCLLERGEISLAPFGDNARSTIDSFYATVAPMIFDLILKQTANFSNSLELILENFVNLQAQLSFHVQSNILPRVPSDPRDFGFLNANAYQKNLEQWWTNITPRDEKPDLNKVSRYIARDGLLRILTYEYCREHFNQLSLHNGLHSIRGDGQNAMAESIRLSLEDLSNIDFKQIINMRFLEYIPENFDQRTYKIIHEFIGKLRPNISNAIRENGSIAYLLNLILQNDRLYPWEEVNGDGKVMTDPELADFVTWLSLKLLAKSDLPEVFEPGVGTGNILTSLYETMRNQYPRPSHNEILKHLHGCENDYFLGKLAVLNLTMKSPREVDQGTSIDIKISNFFSLGAEEFGKYNLIIMNPPFLRNDNKVSNLRRDYLEERIERITSVPSYMKNSSQPNYFFYFIELAAKLIENGGILCSFISNSALSTKNGTVLKKFLLENFELKYIIVPPRIFFQNYMVTPCLIIGRRKSNPEVVNNLEFVRIFESDFFTIDYNLFLSNLNGLNGKLYHQKIKQSSLRPEDDWRKYLLPIPPYYVSFQNSKLFSCLDNVFSEIMRGGLASEGNGSGFFFPWSNGEVRNKLKTELDSIEPEFAQLGLNNAKISNNYILTQDDLEQQKVLSYSRSTNLENFAGLKGFIQKYESKFTLPRRPYAEDFPYSAQLIVPRAIRKTHSVYLNPNWEERKVYFSSNFLCLWGLKERILGYPDNEVLKFIAAFLNSSFGQLMFEIESIDREGLRKIEKFNLSKIFIPIKNLGKDEEIVKEIIKEFEFLPYGLTGLENAPSSRYKLDSAISRLLWKHDPSFRSYATSPEDFAKELELDLRNIVRIRMEK